MTDPLVTVITPTYNRGRTYLTETIESVLAQDYPNFEYLVLDDGSTDNTREVVAQYDDPRLQYHYHDNVGEAETVNRGLNLAQGQYIVVVNSDDPLLPGALAECAASLSANPQAWVVYPDWIKIDDQSNPLETIVTFEMSYAGMLRNHHCPPGPGAMFRNDVISLGIRRDRRWRYVSDYAFWLQVGRHGRLLRLPKVLATWRTHAGGATQLQSNRAMAAEHVAVVKTYYQQPDVPPEARSVKREAISSAHYIAGTLCLPRYHHAARIHFVKSILASPNAPIQYPNFRRNWRLMLGVVLLPGPLFRFLRHARAQRRETP